MKTIYILIFSFTFLFSGNIDFAENLSLAKEKAIKSNKPLMIMYSTATCPECNYMKKKVFKNDEVSSYVNKNFIPVVMDINEDKKQLPYPFIGIPTFFFSDATNMKLINKSLGGMREEKFLTVLKSIEK